MISCFAALLSVLVVAAAADGTRWRPKVRILVVQGVCRRHPRTPRYGSETGSKVGFFGCFVLWLCMRLSFFERFGFGDDGGVSWCVTEGE